MKPIQFSSRILPLLAVTILAASCIYDRPAGDEFYRTLWKSDEAPHVPMDVSSLTLEFLCNEGISITTTSSSAPGVSELKTIYGTYACDGLTATFRTLTLYLPKSNTSGSSGDYTIIFMEAHRNGDTLMLVWTLEDNPQTQFSTTMHRLSDYEN